MSHFESTRGAPDPGPPTWREAIEGFVRMRTIAGDRVRAAASMRVDIAPGDGSTHDKACETHSAADADWKHWALMARRYEAFVKLHPAMVDVKIDAPCEHKNACWVGDDEGYYRDPNPLPTQSRVLPREREPGDDDETEAA